MIYLLKLDNQAVDKKNTEDHSPWANVSYINLCILCYDCLDLPGRSKIKDQNIKCQAKVSKGRKRPENGLLIFVKTLFTLNNWFPLGQRAFTITEI